MLVKSLYRPLSVAQFGVILEPGTFQLLAEGESKVLSLFSLRFVARCFLALSARASAHYLTFCACYVDFTFVKSPHVVLQASKFLISEVYSVLARFLKDCDANQLVRKTVSG